MDRKLITLDLDGTTLNTASVLTKRTINTIKAAEKAGHIVSIVTGRPNRISENFHDQLGLKSPMVNFNGALAYLPHQRWDKEYEETVNKDLAFDLLRMKDKYGINMIAAEGKELLLADTIFDKKSTFFPTTLTSRQILNEQNLKTNPTSVTLFIDRADQDQIIHDIKQAYGEVDIRIWGGPNAVLEVVAKGVQKAKGVAYLADYYQIKQKDIIAMGDESNDKEMLEYAGWGVAMVNGTEEIRGLANDVTTYDNAHDGMARYLENHLHLDV